uniref:Synembryn-A n=1 Tax=Gongylonema pulchrum TaxID=637853 RepID=A0A183DVT3_9BILA
LRFVRVLARDQSNLDELLCAELVQRVLDASFPRSSGEFHWETLVQAEMCLINLLFNSNLAREQFTEVCTQLLHRIARLAGPVQQQPPAQTNQSAAASEELQFLEALDSEQASQIVFYDLRIAFVASAHSKKLQSRWRKSGCEVFLDVLERSLPLPEKLKVDCGETESNKDAELLGTYLTVLIHLCSQVKEARRYVRLRVLPPLHAMDVKRRPDEGAELRNRLIRLMTSISNSCNLAAEFIFILCKKSVSRFVKYCGFGHAAGLLANRGILGALNTPKNPSDSEDSETEDYKAVQGQVNPVTGCIEQPGEDPFAGMTEEQKEYEVHRLMNDISKLMDQGVITPGQIGPDGRLRPAKHVLELVKNADDKTSENASDSDVD